MARGALPMFVFNRGLVSRLGVARVDLKRLAMGARQMKNWVVRGLGAMNIRPGTGYLSSTHSNAAARFLDFVFSTTDTALLELTNLLLRVWVSDAVVTRASVATTVTNGTFTTDLTGWSDDDESGGVSTWVSPGYMQLVGNGTAAAVRTQTLTVAGADLSVEHALNIVIARGPVTLRVGSAAGLDDYISETALAEGTHSLTFTPTGNVFIRLQSTLKRVVWVDSVAIATAGAMTVTSPYPAAALGLVRPASSGDVVFLACSGYQQYKIERRATRGWSMVKFLVDNGPFMVQNIGPITMTPSVLSGNGTLTASKAYFKSTNVGGLFSHTSTGQRVTVSVTAENTFTNAIQVTGTGTDRTITINISNTFTATVTLQRSFDSATGPWVDVTAVGPWTAPVVTSYTDALNNQTVWYRLGVKTGDFTSGQADLILSIPTGSIRGIARVTAYTSATVVDIEVLTEFGSTNASDVWQEGVWSDRRGWPSAAAFHEGRLWWAGKDKILGSVSDDFANHDETVEGDSGPINRSIGSGPVDSFSWLLPLQRLVLGAQGAEFSCRSTSLDEPLSPTNFNLKPSSTQGSAAVTGIKVDAFGIYVQRGGIRVYQLEIDPSSYDFKSTNLTAVIPEIGKPGIVRAAVQRQPETRVHFVRSDGTVALLQFDVNEQVVCWSEIETDGLIEDAVVLPSTANVEDDQVYYVVKRTINGSTVRYLEKWAYEVDCRPDSNGTLAACKLADSYVTYTGGAATITGLSHLEGEQVVVWADGQDVGHDDDLNLIYTVTGGQITLPTAAASVVVGLPYTATWQSTKLLQMQTQLGSPVGKYKTITGLSFLLADTHARGLQFGRSFTDMDDMPSIEEGSEVDGDSITVDYDNEQIIWPGDFSTDERVCLRAIAPRPCTVLAAVPEVTVNE
jgi:hypothetical protein